MKHPDTTVDKALELYDQGHNAHNIARKLGVARQTVRRWVIPGERERHNSYIYRSRNQTPKPVTPEDKAQSYRVLTHIERIRKELSHGKA